MTALYGFGFFDTPYIGTFRVAFYFFLLFLVVTIVVGVATQSHYGYDPPREPHRAAQSTTLPD